MAHDDLDKHAGAGLEATGVPGAPQGARPAALLLTFLGSYVLGRDIAVFTGSYIEVFQRLGVLEHTTRSALARMAGRGLLQRHRRGRRAYFGLTRRAVEILNDGKRRVEELGPINRAWDGRWTLLGFSLPESRRPDRHDLRARLRWAGFGPLQGGLWVSPSQVDAEWLLGGLGLDEHVRVFQAEVSPPTDVDRMIREAFDLDGLVARYRGFLDRWDRPEPLPAAHDDLARRIWLLTEWLLLVRDDPRLPLGLLPETWPAVRAEGVFHRWSDAYRASATRVADELIDRIPVHRDEAIS
jgi:phenylacetic acid degradation operon negative regulatory protein